LRLAGSCVSLARPDPHGVWMVGGAALGGRPVSPDRSCGRDTVVRRRGRASRSLQQPERARARPESYPPLGRKRQRRWGSRPFCTPGARLPILIRGAGRLAGAASAATEALSTGKVLAREGRWSLPGGACGRRDVGFGVASSAGERGTARGSQTSRTGFVWAAEATSLAATAGATARWAEASVKRAALRSCSPDPATDGMGAARSSGAGRAGRPSRPSGALPAGYRAAEQPESTSTFRPAMWPARPTRAWSIAVAVLLMIRLKWSKLQWARGQLGGRWRRCSGCYGGSVESASVRKRLQRSLYRRYGELRRRESSLSLAAPRAVSKDRAAP